MHRNNNGWMALPVVASLALGSPASAMASQPRPPCSGTLFQLAVHEQAVGDVDRFRFSLGLTGEGRTEAAALKQLNQRLGQLRRDLTPLMQGTLTVPAPRTHQRGGSGSAAPKVFVASTTLSGEVGPGRYDALIQVAGGRPGVRLHGMTSLANAASALADEQRAVARALERGRQEAQWVARSIGRRRVKLQQIDRRGAVRPLMQARTSTPAMGFDPSEAPKPRASVHLQLTYCLSD